MCSIHPPLQNMPYYYPRRQKIIPPSLSTSFLLFKCQYHYSNTHLSHRYQMVSCKLNLDMSILIRTYTECTNGIKCWSEFFFYSNICSNDQIAHLYEISLRFFLTGHLSNLYSISCYRVYTAAVQRPFPVMTSHMSVPLNNWAYL